MRPAVLLVLAAACSSAPPSSSKKEAPLATPVAQDPGLLDSGKFVFVAGDAELGEETFEISEKKQLGFQVKTSSKLSLGPDNTVEASSLITLDATGKPAGMELKSQKSGGEPITAKVLRKDGKLVGEAGGKALSERAPSDLLIADGYVTHWAPVCALAGPEARTLSVFPGIPMKVDPVIARKMQIVGKDGKAAESEITSVIVDFGGMRIELACDGVRLMSLFQPMTGVLAFRPGFEAVARKLAIVNRPKPTLPDTLVEEDRAVAAGDATLACSLVLPKERKKKVPAVVFITGSGPQDRDEDSPGGGGLKGALFKELAIALGQAGIGSLRCDDRGVARSTGEFAKGTLETWVADTRAAVAALRGEGAVDERRIALVGHSEGAIIAPIVAGADKQLKAVVLMAGPGRPLADLVLEQTTASAKRLGQSDEDAAKQTEQARAIFAAIREGKPLPDGLPPAAQQALELQRPWLASHAKHDPRAAAAKLKVPVFIGQGGKDVQVQVKDAEILRDTLAKAGNKRVTYKIYEDLNHLFTATKTGSVADYGDRNAKVDATFVTDVVAFLTKSL